MQKVKDLYTGGELLLRLNFFVHHSLSADDDQPTTSNTQVRYLYISILLLEYIKNN